MAHETPMRHAVSRGFRPQLLVVVALVAIGLLLVGGKSPRAEVPMTAPLHETMN